MLEFYYCYIRLVSNLRKMLNTANILFYLVKFGILLLQESFLLPKVVVSSLLFISVNVLQCEIYVFDFVIHIL